MFLCLDAGLKTCGVTLKYELFGMCPAAYSTSTSAPHRDDFLEHASLSYRHKVIGWNSLFIYAHRTVWLVYSRREYVRWKTPDILAECFANAILR